MSLIEPREIVMHTDRYSDAPRFLRVKIYTAAECAAFEAANPERLVVTEAPKPEMRPDPANPLRYEQTRVPAVRRGRPKPAVKWVRKSQAKSTRKAAAKVMIESIIERQRLGMTAAEIAKDLGVGYQVVMGLQHRLRKRSEEYRKLAEEMRTCPTEKCGRPKFARMDLCARCRKNRRRKQQRAAGRESEGAGA